MRRLLRNVAENRSLGDVTTLTDPTVVNMLDEQMKDASAAAKVDLSAPVRAGLMRSDRTGRASCSSS
jgi:hypothetical protein